MIDALSRAQSLISAVTRVTPDVSLSVCLQGTIVSHDPLDLTTVLVSQGG